MRRREMLRLLASAAVPPLISALPADMRAFGREVHAAVQRGASEKRALDEASSRIVSAACERIIPADQTPGALAAGVPQFIDRVLTDWCDASERRLFLEGLAVLDRRSRQTYGGPFVERSELEQTAILTAVDEEYAAWRRGRPSATAAPGVQSLPAHGFGMLKFLTIWGYFTSDVGQQQELGLYPRPTTYNGCATYVPRQQRAKTVASPGE